MGKYTNRETYYRDMLARILANSPEGSIPYLIAEHALEYADYVNTDPEKASRVGKLDESLSREYDPNTKESPDVW